MVVMVLLLFLLLFCCHAEEPLLWQVLLVALAVFSVVATQKNLFLVRFSLMLVTVQLTDHGERHVDAIIKTVFQYINMLKKNLPNKPFFDELVVSISDTM